MCPDRHRSGSNQSPSSHTAVIKHVQIDTGWTQINLLPHTAVIKHAVIKHVQIDTGWTQINLLPHICSDEMCSDRHRLNGPKIPFY